MTRREFTESEKKVVITMKEKKYKYKDICDILRCSPAAITKIYNNL